MKNDDSHIILYAKGWYKRNDVIKDMKIILGERGCIEPRHVSPNNIVGVLSKLIFPYVDDKYKFSSFLENILCSYFDFEMHKEPLVKFIDACLSILSKLQIKDNEGNILLELDDPDYELLPEAEY
jgi:hypothetical protein